MLLSDTRTRIQRHKNEGKQLSLGHNTRTIKIPFAKKKIQKFIESDSVVHENQLNNKQKKKHKNS